MMKIQQFESHSYSGSILWMTVPSVPHGEGLGDSSAKNFFKRKRKKEAGAQKKGC